MNDLNINKIILVVGFIILGFTSFSQNNKAIADSAELYFKESQYQKSAEAYEKIVASGKESAALYYNLANAYYKSNNIPLAITNYERARVLDPNDEDIAFNLRLAQTQTIDKIENLPMFFLSKWYNSLTGVMSTNIWAYLSIFALLLSLSLLLFYLFSHSMRLKKITFWSASFLRRAALRCSCT